MRKLIFIVIVVITSVTYLNAQNSDKEIKFGGRLMYDIAIWGPENFENAGSELRRVRLFSKSSSRRNEWFRFFESEGHDIYY